MYSENYLVNSVWFVLVHYNLLIYVMLTVDVVTFFPPPEKTCTEHKMSVSRRFESVICQYYIRNQQDATLAVLQDHST